MFFTLTYSSIVPSHEIQILYSFTTPLCIREIHSLVLENFPIGFYMTVLLASDFTRWYSPCNSVTIVMISLKL